MLQRWQRRSEEGSPGPPHDLAKGGLREDAHVDLGHEEVLSPQKQRERQARMK